MSRRRAQPGRLPGRSLPDAGRWWYWVAAVPAVTAVWALSFVWLAIAATAEFGAGGIGGDTVGVAFSLSLVVAGVPLAVVLVLLPVAVTKDARALAAVDAPWQPDPRRWGLLALAGAVTVVGGVLVATRYTWRRLTMGG
ncbi:MAG: hypothetical protein ABEJ68_02550 [Halobacteriaceae archaeon]